MATRLTGAAMRVNYAPVGEIREVLHADTDADTLPVRRRKRKSVPPARVCAYNMLLANMLNPPTNSRHRRGQTYTKTVVVVESSSCPLEANHKSIRRSVIGNSDRVHTQSDCTGGQG